MTNRAIPRHATLTVDAEYTSVSRSIAALARASARAGGPLVVISHRALDELATELGGYERAAHQLLSQTMFISPKDWSQERLAGWAAGHRDELERAFGSATPIP